MDTKKEKKVVETLKKSENKYKNIFLLLPIPYQSLDIDGNIIEVNPTWLTTLKYAKEEVIGKHFSTFISKTTKSMFMKKFEVFKTKGVVESIPFTLTKKTGEKISVEFYGRVEYDDNNIFKKSHCIFHNISSRKQSEEKFKVAFQTSPNTISISTIEGEYIEVNQSFQDILGYQREEVIHKKNMVHTLWKKPEERAELIKQLQEKTKAETEIQAVCKNGEEKTFHISSQLLTIEGEKFLFTIGKEITKEKKALEQLKESEEKFRTAFRTSPDSINLNTLDGTYIDINEGFTNIIGYTREEIIGKKSTDMNIWKHKEDREKLVNELQKNASTELEAEFLTKKKETIIGLMKAKIITINDQKVILSVTKNITKERIAEEKIKSERDEKQLYLDTAEVIMIALDRQGKVVLINRKGCEALGWKEEDIIGKNWFDNFLPEHDREKIRRNFDGLFKKEVAYFKYNENPIITKSGEERLIAWHNNYLQDTQGNIISTLSSGNDITEQKKVEEALKESEEKYRFLFDNMLNGFAYHKMLFNEKGEPNNYIFLEVNKAFEEITGIKRELVKDKKITEVIPGISKDSAKGIPKYGEVALTGKAKKFESYSEKAKKWFSITAFSPQKNYFATIFEDITTRKEAEKHIRHSRDKLKKIINNTSQLIISVDKDGMVNEWNKIIEQYTGIKEEEIKDKHISTLPEELKSITEEITTALSSGKKSTNEHNIHDKEHNPRTIMAITNILRDENYQVEGVILVARDISYQKNMYEELKKGKAYISEQNLDTLSKVFASKTSTYENFLCICRNPQSKSSLLTEAQREKQKHVHEIILGEGKEQITATTLLQAIQEKSTTNSLILLTRLDYLINQLGFTQTMKQLYALHDYVENNNHTLIIHISKNYLDEKEYSLLKQEFHVLQEQKKDINEKQQNIIKYIDEKTKNKLSVNYNNIARRFDISRVTVRTWIDELQEKRLVKVQKTGKEKTLSLTLEAEQYL